MDETKAVMEPALVFLRDQVAQSQLLPAAYAQYRPLVADALHFFLGQLPVRRLRPILLEQARLSSSTDMEQRFVALLRHVPALHKLGQVVARDRRLSIRLRQKLQQLETLPPSIPGGMVRRLIQKELGPAAMPRIELGSEALAEGSVAVVVPFKWRDGAREVKREGVLKVLKPGIEKRLREDLGVLTRLGRFLDSRCELYKLPALDYAETFEKIRNLLGHEVHLNREQEHLREAAGLYRATDSVLIPELLPFCTARVTAMERVRGRKVADSLLRPPMCRALATAVGQALVAMPVFSAQSDALFHADPHAGNLMVTRGGQLAILDWSLTGRLGKTERVELVQLLLGAVAFDRAKMGAAVRNMAVGTPEHQRVDDCVDQALGELRRGAFPGIGWLTRLMDQLILHAKLKVAGDLMLFRKSLVTLEGVLADLLPGENAGRSALDQAFAATFMSRWGAEWPERFRAPLATRRFATHVSTADLLWWVWSSPGILTRWWTHAGLDLLEMARTSARALRPVPAA